VRVLVAQKYELVVQHAASKADFFRFALNVSAARAHATRTLATGLPNELTAGSNYTVVIAPHDIFGNAVGHTDEDIAARILATPADMVVCCERRSDGFYTARVTPPGSAAYSSFDVRVQLLEVGGEFESWGRQGGVRDVIGSPMPVIVTDAQGHLRPEDGDEDTLMTTLLVAVAALLVLSAVVAVEVACWRARRVSIIGARYIRSGSQPTGFACRTSGLSMNSIR